MASKLRIAWFSALDFEATRPSLSAYFSRRILPLLKSEFEIELFHDKFEKAPGFESGHYLSAFKRHKQAPFDLFFYQIEDRPETNFSRMHLGLMPGIALFHDFVFSTPQPEALVESPWCEAFFGEEVDPFKSPIGFREGGLCRGAIFTDARQAEEFKRSVAMRLKLGDFPAPDAYHVPLPVLEIGAAQKKSHDLIAFCGSVRIEHRAHKIFEALAELKEPYRFVWLVEDGELEKANELALEFGLSSIQIIGGKTPEKWNQICKEAALSLHTHFSVYGQLGPYLQISLSHGAPSIVTRFGAAEYLPEELLFKVEPGAGEELQYLEIFRKVLASSNQELSNKLLAFASDCYSDRKVAAELSYAFNSFAPGLKRAYQNFELTLLKAREKLLFISERKLGLAADGSIESVLASGKNSTWEMLLKASFEELRFK